MVWLWPSGEPTSAAWGEPRKVLAICRAPRTITIAVVPPISARNLPTRFASLPAAEANSRDPDAALFTGASRPAAWAAWRAAAMKLDLLPGELPPGSEMTGGLAPMSTDSEAAIRPAGDPGGPRRDPPEPRSS